MEIEIVADTRESRDIEDRREPLQAKFFLDTFRRILDRKNRDLREHTDQLRKAPPSNKFEVLISQDKLDIRALEDSIRRVQGGSFKSKGSPCVPVLVLYSVPFQIEESKI